MGLDTFRLMTTVLSAGFSRITPGSGLGTKGGGLVLAGLGVFLCNEHDFHWISSRFWTRSTTLVARRVLLWSALSLEWTPLEVSLWLLPGGSGGEEELSVLRVSERGVSSSWGMPESALLKHRGV
jgi:hypothetical protein